MTTRGCRATLASTLAASKAGALTRGCTFATTSVLGRRRSSLLMFFLLLHLLLLLLLLLLHLGSVDLRFQVLDRVILLIRIKVCEPVIALLHHEVLYLKSVGLGI